MSVNEQRVILRILEACQNQVKGLKIKRQYAQNRARTLERRVNDAYL